MHAPRGSGSQPQDNSQAILLAVGAIVAVVALLVVRNWLNSLSPLAAKVAYTGVISTLVFAGSLAFGYFSTTNPNSDKSLLKTKAETELGSQIMFWSAIIAFICFFGVAAVEKFEGEVQPKLKEAFFFQAK